MAEAETGKPVNEALVTASPDAGTRMTFADGEAHFDWIPQGTYAVSAVAKGRSRTTVAGIHVPQGESLLAEIRLPQLAVAGHGPKVATVDAYQVGYGTATGTVASGQDPDDPAEALWYAWVQVSGPPVTAASGWFSPTLSFTTATFEASHGPLPARSGLLGVNFDTSAREVFFVFVGDPDGNVETGNVSIHAAQPVAPIGNVPVGLRFFAKAADGGPPPLWELDRPEGSMAEVEAPTGQAAGVLPDVPGRYVLREAATGASIEVNAGRFVGVSAGHAVECIGCHGGEGASGVFAAWAKTRHATTFSRRYDGEEPSLPSMFNAACLPCHTVGHDRGSVAGGFDDVAIEKGWTFPASQTLRPGNWDRMRQEFPEVARLANVQCESCHGPQESEAHGKRAARVSFASEVCETCHQSRVPVSAGPGAYQVDHGPHSPHRRLDVATAVATVDRMGATAADCARCHSAQGFKEYVRAVAAGEDPLAPLAGNAGVLSASGLTVASAQPVTCSACHDPHDASRPSQVRVAGDWTLAAGFSIAGAGTGALCMACHNSGRGPLSEVAEDWHAPHASCQADVLMARNALGASGTTGGHAAIEGSCARCHVVERPSFVPPWQVTSNHTFVADGSICGACHGPDVDLTQVQAVASSRLAEVQQAFSVGLRQALISWLASSGVRVRAFDPSTGLFSSASDESAGVPLEVIPGGARPVSIAGALGCAADLPEPVEFDVIDALGRVGTVRTSALHFTLASVRTSGGKRLLSPSSPLVRAAWNYLLLARDGSGGVHNLPFFLEVADRTIEEIAADAVLATGGTRPVSRLHVHDSARRLLSPAAHP